MKRCCKRCRKWEKYFYWCHLDHTKISFCKKMDASTFMKQMDLPNEFRRNFKGRIGENVELKVPNGNIWRVGVIKSAEKFTFQSGWKDFVIANNVEANDLLVFKYSGSSSFQVQIFVSNGCERTSACVRIEKIQVQESSDSSIEVFDGSDRIVHQDKITVSDSSSDSDYSTDTAPEKVPTGRASRSGTSKESNGRGMFKENTNVQITFPIRLVLSPSQRGRVLQLSKRIQPENHCFAILITLSKILGKNKITVPTKFASKHLLQHAKEAILNYKGLARRVSILYKVSCPYFSAGWKQFAKDNNLGEGDICVFELTRKNNETVSFKVHISRN